jgi:hypothetical protein
MKVVPLPEIFALEQASRRASFKHLSKEGAQKRFAACHIREQILIIRSPENEP